MAEPTPSRRNTLLGIAFGILVVILILLFALMCVRHFKRNYAVIPTSKWDSMFTPRSVTGDVEAQMDLKYFSSKKLVICGLLREKESQIAYLRQRFRQWTGMFADWAVVVVENDSDDRTREYLLQWQAQCPDNVFILGCGLNQPTCELKLPKTLVHNKSASRIRKMVHLREEYRQFVRDHPRLSHFDFTMVTDMDLRGYTYYDGLWNTAHQFSADVEGTIDAIASNGIQVFAPSPAINVLAYQDPYAHEDEETTDGRKYNHVAEFLRGTPFGSKMLKVKSAFGGLTIYRTRSFLASKYLLEIDPQTDTALCEHVTFHRQMRQVYLNQSFVHLIYENADGFESNHSHLRPEAAKIKSNR